MKKKLILALSFVMVAVVALSVGVYAASDIKLFVNGKQASAQVEIINGSSYVPLRAVAEMLGAEVNFDNTTRTITITSQGAVAPAPDTAESYEVDATVTSGPMTMKISKVTLDSAFQSSPYLDPINAIIFDVDVENTSSENISWHPHQGTLVLNTKEQAEASHSLFHSDSVGGDFLGKVVKKGKIVIQVTSDLSEVNSMSYTINGASNADTWDRVGDDMTVDIVLE